MNHFDAVLSSKLILLSNHSKLVLSTFLVWNYSIQ